MTPTNKPNEIENVLRAEYKFTDEPLELSEIDGIYDAIQEVTETKTSVIVECEDRTSDYRVYWNEKTNTVRIGAIVMCASYEVPREYVEQFEIDQ